MKKITESTAILDKVPEGIISIGRMGNITFVNKSAAGILGHDQAKLVGRPFDDLGLKETVDHQFKLSDHRGRELIVTGYFSQVAGPGSDRVFIFHELRARRTKEENDFLSMASHQLRTPLTVASLYAEMLRAGHVGKLTKEQLHAVEEIVFYHQKINDSLAAFLLASKIEMGTYEVKPRPTQVVAVIDEVVRSVLSKAKHHQVKITKKIPTRVQPVVVDEEVLKIVLHNLLSNAIKFSEPNDEVVVELKTRKNEFQIIIRDEGCGIAPEEQPRIFDKMYRGAKLGGEKTSGTGYGLYVVRELVKRCEASITFNSSPGEGTTFVVTMPRVSAP